MTTPEAVHCADERLMRFENAILQRISSDTLKLPVLPHAIQEVFALQNDPGADAKKISAFIARDQTLSAHVLRVSNSALYAGTREIHSLNQAIARLGERALIKIAVSITLKGEVFRVAGFESFVHEIWQHALVSGSVAQDIALRCGQSDDVMFLCALMHQVGKPVLLQILIDLKQQMKLPLSTEEIDDLLDRYHGQTGHLLARNWRLPEVIETTCLYYNDVAQAPSYWEEVRVTHLASRIANLMLTPDERVLEDLRADDIWQTLGLQQDLLDIWLLYSNDLREELDALFS